MTREERIREKLKFFNLEVEDLKTTKDRILSKVNARSTRFGPHECNLLERKSLDSDTDGKNPAVTTYNPFQEMMAIEAEFGSIFTASEEY